MVLLPDCRRWLRAATIQLYLLDVRPHHIPAKRLMEIPEIVCRFIT